MGQEKLNSLMLTAYRTDKLNDNKKIGEEYCKEYSL